MTESIQQTSISGIISQVNNAFDVHLNAEDFKSASYSSGSLCDILVQKIQDEKSGDWTADVAFHKLRKAIVSVNGINASDITIDTDLNSIFRTTTRKAKLKELEVAMGVPLEILKPNGALYGTFIFLFFVGIPLLSLGWFPAVLTMVVSGIVIYVLTKTANHFKMKTVGLLADHLAWKNYLVDKQRGADFNREEARMKIETMLK